VRQSRTVFIVRTSNVYVPCCEDSSRGLLCSVAVKMEATGSSECRYPTAASHGVTIRNISA
jgi:hypothetical protein